ncbi:MAG: YggS family pyridoxal phosphate-dependent enzyme [Vicinamibacteria bacterium]|nr:YggS family pyridoxal phosphate-dependent enzyme [Vicinamibacteria bacterium]
MAEVVIRDRVAAVRERIARAAARAGRDRANVTLVAVGKNHPASALREAFGAGVRDFGENRVQEAEFKARELGDLGDAIRWHVIGHLQSNKARKILAFTHMLHSLDDMDLAHRLNRIAGDSNVVLKALVQVDLAGETTKFGLPPSDLQNALETLRGLANLEIRGLMILPPYEEDPERLRPLFRRLRELRDQALRSGLMRAGELSMGMSHDLEIAVEEGATFVRVGTAIFGERD